ncbi:DUF1013 domain-containing protein [Alphaproteobacteria bacterium]|nr:DUF1013 domain-containing protein [Alphaproteobacteria bacterium]
MMNAPLMPKASAAWLVDNTALTFQQIAAYTELHALEIQAIADGEIVVGATTYDPITQGHLTWEEIHRCEADPKENLEKLTPETMPAKKRTGGRYVPVSKRGDRPNGIAWIVKHHPEISDAQICRLLGTTRPTIKAIRERTHRNINQIKSQNPVELGLCSQKELEALMPKK